MHLTLSKKAERIIRYLMENDRYASEKEVIEVALRHLNSKPPPLPDVNPPATEDQLLQKRLFAFGLIGDIRPGFRVESVVVHFASIDVEDKPLSEISMRELGSGSGLFSPWRVVV